jgi:hypothetical protein
VGQIQNFITALDSLATGAAPLIPSATQVDNNAEHIKLIAFGSRIYMNKFR